MASTIREGNLEFSFSDEYKTIKFDDTPFYRIYSSKQPQGKGVDILACSDTCLQIIEIKDCKGYETENKWRTKIGYKKVEGKESSNDVEYSFDGEVAQKVANTIACLAGAKTFSNQKESALHLESYWEFLESKKILNDKGKIKVILHLEGQFDGISHARSGNMVRKRIRESLKGKLSWLKCDVLVNGDTEINNHLYIAKRI